MEIPSKTYVFSGFEMSLNILRIMENIINTSAGDPYVRRFAEYITKGVCCSFEKIQEIYLFILKHSDYTPDPYNIEYIKTPKHILQSISRSHRENLDCDDYTVLSLSLVMTLGFPVAIRAVSYAQDMVLSHVYGLIYVEGEWLPLDLCNRHVGLGWERTGATNLKDREV